MKTETKMMKTKAELKAEKGAIRKELREIERQMGEAQRELQVAMRLYQRGEVAGELALKREIRSLEETRKKAVKKRKADALGADRTLRRESLAAKTTVTALAKRRDILLGRLGK